MARRPDLERFSREHGIRIGTIADLIAYRLEKERNVERIAEQAVQTAHGEFTLYCYDDHVNQTVHVALAKGNVGASDAPLSPLGAAPLLLSASTALAHSSAAEA